MTKARQRGRRLAFPALALILQGCVFVPRTVNVYDAQCRIAARQMTLEVAQLGGFVHCANDGCAAMLVAAGVVTAASAVVSGSIVVAGNVVYWFEKKGNCAKAQEPPVPVLVPARDALPPG